MLGAADYRRVYGTQILLSLCYYILNQQEHDVGAMKVAPVFIWIIGEWETLTLNKLSQQIMRMINASLQT